MITRQIVILSRHVAAIARRPGCRALCALPAANVGSGSWLRGNSETEFANRKFVPTSINLKNESAGDGRGDKTIEKTILRTFRARTFSRSQGHLQLSADVMPCPLLPCRLNTCALGDTLRRKRTATSITQCIYSSVSRASLQKTGVFLDSAGDFWEFSAQKVRTSVSRDY